MVLCKAGCLKFDKYLRITKKNASLKSASKIGARVCYNYFQLKINV